MKYIGGSITWTVFRRSTKKHSVADVKTSACQSRCTEHLFIEQLLGTPPYAQDSKMEELETIGSW